VLYNEDVSAFYNRPLYRVLGIAVLGSAVLGYGYLGKAPRAEAELEHMKQVLEGQPESK
jgi:hypothetical protein